MLTYDECYDLISRFASRLLPYFADGWSRFPVGQNAENIARELERLAPYSPKLEPVAKTIRARM